MVVLKMLILKKKKKKSCIAIIYHKWKLSPFGRDDTKQGKILISLWSLKQKKLQMHKKNKTNKLKEMLCYVMLREPRCCYGIR